MPIGWAVVGPGKLADVAVVPGIGAQPDSGLVAVCSRDLGRAQVFAERHGGAAAYDHLDRMLADPHVDVVYVASPNALHKEQTLAALRAGKHVLVEKPMALNLADGREMVRAARDNGLKLAVGFHLRHKPSNHAARRAVADGRVGRVFLVEMEFGAGTSLFPYDTWRADPGLAGGGTLINQGTHCVDLVQFMTGQRIRRVSATVDRQPLDNVFAALCTLDQGAIAMLASYQFYSGPRPDYMLLGEAGWINGKGTTGATGGDSLVVYDPSGEATMPGSERPAHWDEVDAFAQAVLGQAPVNGDGEDGLANIAVVEAIYRSAREGRAVEVEPTW